MNLPGEKEKYSGGTPSGGHPKPEEEIIDQFDNELEDITSLISLLMPRFPAHNPTEEIDPILEKRLQHINNRARNAVEALSTQLEFLGRLFWQRSYSDQYTDPPGQEDCNEFGQLVQNLAGMLRACIRLEENSRVRLESYSLKVR